jgi:hypothetical protein
MFEEISEKVPEISEGSRFFRDLLRRKYDDTDTDCD